MRHRWQRTQPAILPPPDEAARLVRPVVPGARIQACTGLAGGLANSNVRIDIAGHAPLVMKRELDGFIMNRLQGALLEEAFRLVADGYASIEDVDIGIRDGLALRWSFMGPFETIDLNAPAGVRDYVERYQGIYETMFHQMQRRVDWAGPVLETVEADRRAKLPADGLAERQVWRDRRLMALAAHKRRSDDDIGT